MLVLRLRIYSIASVRYCKYVFNRVRTKGFFNHFCTYQPKLHKELLYCQSVMEGKREYWHTLLKKVMESKKPFDPSKNKIILQISEKLHQPDDTLPLKYLHEVSLDELKDALWYCVNISYEKQRQGNVFRTFRELNLQFQSRFSSLTTEDIFLISNGIIELRFPRDRGFLRMALEKLVESFLAGKLNKYEMVHVFYILSASREFPNGCNVTHFQKVVSSKVRDLSLEELAIIGSGFFKAQTPITEPALVSYFIDEFTNRFYESGNIMISNLCKIIQYSLTADLRNKLVLLQDSLIHVMPEVSCSTLGHILTIGIKDNVCNPQFYLEGIKNFKLVISSARLKDISRVVFCAALFNIIDKEFIDLVVSHVRQNLEQWSQNPERLVEFVHHMIALQTPLVDLMKIVLSHEYLQHSRVTYNLYYPLKVIETTALIDVTNYNGPTLGEAFKKGEASSSKNSYWKKFSEQSEKQFNLNAKFGNTSRSAKFILQLKESLKKHYGENFDHSALLPYGMLIYFVLIFNKNLEIQPIPETWKSRDWKKVNFVPKDENIWLCLMVVGQNQMDFKTKVFLPSARIQINHLKQLGFHVLTVRNDFKLDYGRKEKSALQLLINSKLKRIQPMSA